MREAIVQFCFVSLDLVGINYGVFSSNSYYFSITDGVVVATWATDEPKISTQCFPLIRRQGCVLVIREKVIDNIAITHCDTKVEHSITHLYVIVPFPAPP